MIARHYTSSSIDPLTQIKWVTRDAILRNERGEVLFQQLQVEVPDFWSQLATDVVASKYLRTDTHSRIRESGVRALVGRVVNTIGAWSCAAGHLGNDVARTTFEAELSYLLLHQHASFNSPVWFNVGIQPLPQCSACFIIAAEDSMEALLELQRVEGMLFKHGSGTGSNLSKIRSSKEALSAGGYASGPVAFMRAFDAWAGVIKSGGTTRRAAKMQILNATHPDILDFIHCKAQEEERARILSKSGYDSKFSASDGAYESVAFQNANLSVRVSDDFMCRVESDQSYETLQVSTGAPFETLRARAVLRAMAEAAYRCGDPGIQFDTTINSWHTTPASGRINASNPCSEYMHVDNSACNLASINLGKYIGSARTFNIEAFEHTVQVLLLAQDAIVDHSSYPTSAIEQNAKGFRQLGLGFANLGACLMRYGIPYDSSEGRAFAACVAALLGGCAYRTSALLAQNLGAFKHFALNRDAMLSVIKRHREALDGIMSFDWLVPLRDAAYRAWRDAEDFGIRYGFRNSQVTAIAPTGTIAFMMDCDTTGIEPDIALVKRKHLADGSTVLIVNHSVRASLQTLGYSEHDCNSIVNWIETHQSLDGCTLLRPEHAKVFQCAYASEGIDAISPDGHLLMMAAVQPFISGAISKTVNLPRTATVEDIERVFLRGWKLGLKSLAIYRDASKVSQPLAITSAQKEPALAHTRCRVCNSPVIVQQAGCTICYNCGSQTGCT